MVTTRTFTGLSCALSMTLSALSLAPSAEAHGGFPRAFEILVEPGNPDDVLLRSDLWGFFRTRDGGKTWQWTCAETYGADSLSVNHQSIAIAAGGRVIVANSFKGVRYTDDGCQWTESPEFSGKLVVAVEIVTSTVIVVTSTNSNGDGGISGLLWQSKDNGDHYQTFGGPLPTDFAASALGVAPSDTKRVYIVGRLLEQTPGTLERSDDGGSTWKEFGIPMTDGFMTLRVAGIHPTNPDVFFVWGDLKEDYGQDAPDELWGTADGGTTWKKVYTAVGDLPGFAFSPDGTQVLVAGPKEGLELAKVDEALASGQTAFSQDFTTPTRPDPKDRQVWGLRWDATGLTGGLDNFTRRGVPAMTYGAWADPDKTFNELMSVCDAQFGACGAGTTVAASCTGIYDNVQGGFLQDYLRSSRCAGTTGAGGAGDAGSGGGGAGAGTVTPGKTGSSGGCAVATSSADCTGAVGASLAGLLLAGRRLRARRRR